MAPAQSLIGVALPSMVIADDNAAVRCWMRERLEADYCIVACIGDGQAAVDACEMYHPSILVIDISMPVMNGFEAARAAILESPLLRVLIVSTNNSVAYVEAARDCGASGYLVKMGFRDLRTAARAVCDGGTYWPPS